MITDEYKLVMVALDSGYSFYGVIEKIVSDNIYVIFDLITNKKNKLQNALLIADEFLLELNNVMEIRIFCRKTSYGDYLAIRDLYLAGHDSIIRRYVAKYRYIEK